jgi:hypothetical protein
MNGDEMNIVKKENGYTCAICGRDFNSYNSAYVHLRRIHPTHPSMRREVYDEQNIPSAPLFTHPEILRREPEYREPSYHEPVQYNPEYYEPTHYERRDKEEKEVSNKEDNGKGAAIVIFIIGIIAVGIWLYFRYFKGKFDFFGIFENNAADEDGDIEPAFRVNNSVPVTKDGAWPVFDVRGEA